MQRSALHYHLPPELIAQHPPAQRSASRLLIVDRTQGTFTDAMFSDLPQLLCAGEVLVLNNSRVVPARFFLRRASGARIEGLWLAEQSTGVWDVLLRGASSVRAQETLAFEEAAHLQATITQRGRRGRHTLHIAPAQPALDVLRQVGCAPLPPYIKRPQHRATDEDLQRYQTVYARHDGSIAAPTAGLHFDRELLHSVTERGVEVLEVTLHVGWGTFAPLEVEDLAEHDMHEELYEVAPETVERLRAAHSAGRKIVAVGTTSARVLETLAATGQAAGSSKLFIYPPREFRYVGALLTNLHLPESTLLALVWALGGTVLMRRAYEHAVAQRYRFFSYGDAMFVC